MAEIYNELVNWQASGVATRYPWAQWLDGNTWILDPQEDFGLEPTAPIAIPRRWVYQARDRLAHVEGGPIKVRTKTVVDETGRVRLLVSAVRGS